jgi:hypothetical protein
MNIFLTFLFIASSFCTTLCAGEISDTFSKEYKPLITCITLYEKNWEICERDMLLKFDFSEKQVMYFDQNTDPKSCIKKGLRRFAVKKGLEFAKYLYDNSALSSKFSKKKSVASSAYPAPVGIQRAKSSQPLRKSFKPKLSLKSKYDYKIAFKFSRSF